MKKEVGKITHYFSKIGVAVVRVEDEIKVGDEVSIEGHSTKFKQRVESMQIDKKSIDVAKPGEAIGLKVIEKVRPGDKVYKEI